jgi:hypothetical protein
MSKSWIIPLPKFSSGWTTTNSSRVCPYMSLKEAPDLGYEGQPDGQGYAANIWEV